MIKKRLGKTGIVVSEVALGTATFTGLCNEFDSFQIFEKASEYGINFIDTAENYPIVFNENLVTQAEKFLGKWLKNKSRDSFILSSKVNGPSFGTFLSPLRSGNTALDRVHIKKALEGSLKRLQTDYIDLYQVHWPDHDFGYEETLETLTELQKEGKVRAIGCCNETPWGLMKSLEVARINSFMQYQTIQESFSLIDRSCERAMKEICEREKVSLLAYSPTAGGTLTGKYLNLNNLPTDTRYSIIEQSSSKNLKSVKNKLLNQNTLKFTEEFVKMAKELEINPTQLAIAWSKQHSFVASTIIGVRSLEQLEENLARVDFVIPKDFMQQLDKLSKEIMYPMGI